MYGHHSWHVAVTESRLAPTRHTCEATKQNVWNSRKNLVTSHQWPWSVVRLREALTVGTSTLAICSWVSTSLFVIQWMSQTVYFTSTSTHFGSRRLYSSIGFLQWQIKWTVMGLGFYFRRFWRIWFSLVPYSSNTRLYSDCHLPSLILAVLRSASCRTGFSWKGYKIKIKAFTLNRPVTGTFELSKKHDK